MMSESFEHRIKKLLQPLWDVQACLHYPLVANSFPIAYYYANFLKGKVESKDLEKFLEQRDWNNKEISSEELSKAPCHLFFATDDEAQFSGFPDYTFKKINFSKYYPRFIFTDYSSRIVNYLDLTDNLRGNFDKRRDFGDKNFGSEKSIPYYSKIFTAEFIKELGIKKILVFTDTDEEAKHIEEKFLSPLVKEVRILKKNCNDIPVDYVFHDRDVLKLYFFSAPYNMYFLKEVYNYVPFQFKPEEVYTGFETYNFLVSHKDVPENRIDEIVLKVEEFHRSIFTEAATHPENLINVYHAYNELSKTREPFKILDDVHAFSKCLVFHNLDNNLQKTNDETWFALCNTDKSNDYSIDYVGLIDRLKNVYAILSLHHLCKTYEVLEISSSEFYKVLDLLKDSIMIDGKYGLYFRDYVKAELVALIKKYAQLTDNPVKQALADSINSTAILHNVLYHTLRRFYNTDYKTIRTRDAIKAKNKDFDFIQSLNVTRKALEDVHYANVNTLKKTLNIIERYYKEVLTEFEPFKDRSPFQTFLQDAMNNAGFTAAFNELTLDEGHV